MRDNYKYEIEYYIGNLITYTKELLSKIKQISELLETGIYESYVPDKPMTVSNLLKELDLEDKYFGILVNGKKADPNTKISPDDEIVILPHIAGGA
ncbi:MAG: hypothetical protein GF317_11855 [Candidatus Lokiarchaeota archaeon]|nr:hypothetical protein [Candidatus Lokiarchaeota archaeon]MBD3200341.1 hypothetical protein [Candidatus Lokiarchaeota archaeon]